MGLAKGISRADISASSQVLGMADLLALGLGVCGWMMSTQIPGKRKAKTNIQPSLFNSGLLERIPHIVRLHRHRWRNIAISLIDLAPPGSRVKTCNGLVSTVKDFNS